MNDTDYYIKGCTYLANNDNERALKSFQKAFKKNPYNTGVLFGLAIVEEKRDKPKTAIFFYEKIIKIDKNFLAAYINLACLYLRMGYFNAAIDYYKKLLVINPGNTRGLLGLGVAYDKAGIIKDAIQNYKKYLDIKGIRKNSQYVLRRIKQLKEQVK